MAGKGITELKRATSVSDTDLFITETAEGTCSIPYSVMSEPINRGIAEGVESILNSDRNIANELITLLNQIKSDFTTLMTPPVMTNSEIAGVHTLTSDNTTFSNDGEGNVIADVINEICNHSEKELSILIKLDEAGLLTNKIFIPPHGFLSDFKHKIYGINISVTDAETELTEGTIVEFSINAEKEV